MNACNYDLEIVMPISYLFQLNTQSPLHTFTTYSKCKSKNIHWKICSIVRNIQRPYVRNNARNRQ